MKQNIANIYINFLKFFLPVPLILVTASILLVHYQETVLKKEISTRENSTLSLGKAVIETTLSAHLSDAIFLAKVTGNSFGKYINKLVLREELAREFKIFSAIRGVYDQIRYIDHSGMEFVRINLTQKGPWVVPKEDLQNKRRRYYFKKGLRAKSEIYISKFDLNIESGQIEKPFKPMLRFSTPVFDEGSEIQGVIVLNYLGINILEHVRRISKKSDSNIFFVNQDGYWIIGPKPSDEWGFMFDKGKSKTISAQYPTAWQTISSSVDGQFLNSNGLFTFHQISPLSPTQPGMVKAHRGEVDETWKIISIIHPDMLVWPWRVTVYGVCLSFIIVFGCIIWFWTKAKVGRNEHLLAIKESENTFRTVTNSVRDAIIMMDSSGKAFFWNSAATELFGYEFDEVIGRDLHSLIAPAKLHKKISTSLSRFNEKGESQVFAGLPELPGYRKNGTEFVAELSVNYLEMKGERYALGTVRDITERKRAEEEIRLLNEDLDERVKQRTLELEGVNQELRNQQAELKRLSLVIEQSPAIVVITDIKGNIEYVNPAFSKVSGFSSEEAIGQNPRILKSGEHSAEFYNELWNTIISGQIWNGELANKRKNGEIYWENTTISPMRNEADRISHFVAVKEDITERKKVEKELKKHVENLESFNRLTIGREERMIQLKQEVNKLMAQLGNEKKYKIVE